MKPARLATLPVPQPPIPEGADLDRCRATASSKLSRKTLIRCFATVALCAALALGAPAHAATPEEDAAMSLIREQFKDVDLRRMLEQIPPAQ